MSDPLRGKYLTRRGGFMETFKTAKERLAGIEGELFPGEHDYEAFLFVGPGLRLTFYPHKTTAGNYHIRFRASNNSDPDKVRAAVFALAENSCDFQFPSDPEIHRDAVMASLKRERKQA